jgi:hypothetical protein
MSNHGNQQMREACHTDHIHADLVRRAIAPGEIASIGKKIVAGTDGAWPPPPKVNEVVYFGGFPGCERIEIKLLEHSFGLHSGMVPLTDFTEHQLGSTCATLVFRLRVTISAASRAGRCFSRSITMVFGVGGSSA